MAMTSPLVRIATEGPEMTDEAPWTHEWDPIDDTPVRECFDELICLKRRGLLTAEEDGRLVDICQESENTFTVRWWNRRRDPATRTCVDAVTFEPSDALKDLLTAIRTGPSQPGSLSQPHN